MVQKCVIDNTWIKVLKSLFANFIVCRFWKRWSFCEVHPNSGDQILVRLCERYMGKVDLKSGMTYGSSTIASLILLTMWLWRRQSPMQPKFPNMKALWQAHVTCAHASGRRIHGAFKHARCNIFRSYMYLSYLCGYQIWNTWTSQVREIFPTRWYWWVQAHRWVVLTHVL